MCEIVHKIKCNVPNFPDFGASSDGIVTSAFIPHIALVEPIFTNADPSAVLKDPAEMIVFLTFRRLRPSGRIP